MNPTRVVIVTGASRGLGAAVARWLATSGVSLGLIARSGKALDEVAADVQRLGGKALAIGADVADAKACGLAVERTVDRFGRLDALVNNAGILPPLATTAQAAPEDWRYNLAVNLMGPFFMVHHALAPLTYSGGRIVNVSSGAASIPIAAAGAYCAAKAGLNHFTAVLAAEEPSVTALAVRPGVVETRMQEMLRLKSPQAEYYRSIQRSGELEPPEIPGRAVAWLALHAPNEWSGRFMDYDDPQIARPAARTFGENRIKG